MARQTCRQPVTGDALGSLNSERNASSKLVHGQMASGQDLIPVGDDGGLLDERVNAPQRRRYVWQPHRVHKFCCAPQVCIHLQMPPFRSNRILPSCMPCVLVNFSFIHARFLIPIASTLAVKEHFHEVKMQEEGMKLTSKLMTPPKPPSIWSTAM